MYSILQVKEYEEKIGRMEKKVDEQNGEIKELKEKVQTLMGKFACMRSECTIDIFPIQATLTKGCVVTCVSYYFSSEANEARRVKRSEFYLFPRM